MNRRTQAIIAVALLVSAGVLTLALAQRGGARKLGKRGETLVAGFEKVTEPMTSSLRNFSPVLPPKPKPKAERAAPVHRETPVTEAAVIPTPLRPLTIFTSETQPEKPATPDPRSGDYAPAFRLVKCQLVNTVDSSDITTPIIGLVTEDVWWNGKIIIRANSEVHGLAALDRSRERIASQGDFTFILNEPDGRGRELVVRGLALDMDKDDEVDSYGITDGSAGLRGDVIRTANNELIRLYATSLLNGIAGAVSTSASGLLGNRVYTNGSSLGLSALQGGVINPLAGGTQAVLDRYAQQIASAVERDGFFVRVPAGKQFYIYCTEAIDLGKARVGADEERRAREEAELNLEKRRDQVRRALPVDALELLNPLLPALVPKSQNEK
ncbi:MAG: TrbI/VirB10 family protein [Verrucomicrobia bacterium]|nr:TrbI/VirB10 family protein [Verrucomicrobiota bacterium]